MTISELIKDIKGRKFKPVYLLHGEESYYIDVISDLIETTVLSEAERGFNQTIMYGKDSDVMTIVNTAKRFPMMSEYQVVIVKEAQDLKWGKDSDDGKGGDPMLMYLENPSPATILVFCYRNGKFDKRKKTYKAIEKKGVVFESSPIYDNKLPAWVEDYVNSRGYLIDARAAALIAEYLGNDLSKVANELDKLMLNVGKGQSITSTDIENNIGISKEYNVFELQTAIGRKDAFKVNQIINYFAANPKNNPVVLLLGTLNTYFTKILRYHYAQDRSQQALAKELGVSPFFVKDYEQAARNFSRTKVFQIISYLRDCDLKTKGVDANSNTDHGEFVKEMMFKILH